MSDEKKTKQQLIAENEELRRRVAAMESVEAELRRSEAKWRSVAENAPIFVSIVDQSGKMQFLNRYRPGFEPATVLGRSIYDFLQPQSHAVARKCLEHVFQTGEQASYDCVGAGPEGSVSDYVTDVGPVIVDGQIVAATLIAKDITDRKQAEEKLRESEERYRSFVQDFPGIAYRGRMDFSPVFFHGAVEAITGYSEEEFTSGRRRWDQVIHPDDFAQIQESVEKVHSVPGYSTEREYRIVRKDGQIRWVHEIVHNTCDGSEKPAFVQGVLDDITDRKQAEEKLRKSETRFRSLLQDSSVGTVVVSPTGEFLQMNRAFCEFLGYSEQELLGKTVLSVTHPDDRETSSKAIYQAAHSGPRIQRLEKRYLHKSGRVLWGEVSSNLICDADGRPDYFVTQALDITERKRAEEALKKAHDELEERVRERTAELEKANRQLRSEANERKRAEELLAKERAFLRQVIDTTPDIILVKDRAGRYVLGNEAAARFFGSTVQNMVGKTDYDLLLNHGPATDALVIAEQAAHNETDLRVIQSQQPLLVPDFPVTDANGQTHWFTAVKTPLIETDGTCNRMLIAATDITERKWAEEALHESEERYRTLVETSPDGVMMLDLEGHVTFASRQALELHGSEHIEDLVGRNPLEFFAPEDHDKFLANLQRTLKEGITRDVEYTFVRKDESRFVGEASASVIKNGSGQPYALVALLRDITERKRTGEALAASEEKYRLLVETTGTGYVILDGEGRIIDANAEYLRISGRHTLEDILGRTVVEWTAPYDVDRNAKEVEKCYRKGFVRQLEIDYVHPDGKIIPIDINATCLDTEDGRQIVCLCRDITERKQAQEALERERQSLWHMLQASDHERQIISYEIHDGLAQYLAAAGMQFQVFDHLRDSNPEEAKRAYDAAAQLVSQSHFEARRLISEVRPPVIDEDGLETAVSHLVHEQRRRGGPKIECLSNVQFDRLPSILENAIYRIIQEALTNACKHSKSKEVKVTLAQEGSKVRLEVRDWGIGFDPESVEKGHFGLEGIRQRVRLLGGRLTIESTPGSGTLVQVVVPVVERQTEQ